MLNLSEYILHLAALKLDSKSFEDLVLQYIKILKIPLAVHLFQGVDRIFVNWKVLTKIQGTGEITSGVDTILIDSSIDIEWILIKGYEMELTSDLKDRFKLI